MHLRDITTPALILDRNRLQANTDRMAARANELGVALRPHVKTAKSAEVTKLATGADACGIVVSTLDEASYFFEHGFSDMIYAVGIVPGKLKAIDALQSQGAHIRIILDNADNARHIVRKAADLTTDLDILIEIDSGGHRGGIFADSSDLVEIGGIIESSKTTHLAGVLSHAGHAYGCSTPDLIVNVAEQERAAVVGAAKRLRAAGLPCPIVSVGSTPTAVFARHLSGVTEMRPGVYTLFDLTQAQLGCCSVEDVAVSVLTTVIGHGAAKNYALVDAGALALSKDISANAFNAESGYGVVFDQSGQVRMNDIRVENVQQEHGFLTAGGAPIQLQKLPVGSQVRVYPNHACMTAAPYDKYYVVAGSDEIVDVWDKTTGW